MEYLDRHLTMIEFSTDNDIMCHNKMRWWTPQICAPVEKNQIISLMYRAYTIQ
jgi:hypothetical protein